ncbi:MAG: hypothetical protein JOS17DRAFT_729037 [Linnemannia elongata]|nr:MAG: hypothetical protein JOS17DRAFT_729037 [Linnemannia elongata]
MTQPPSLDNLPRELQEIIAGYLSQRDMAISIRVCQAWKQLLLPYVWRHIEYKEWSESRSWNVKVERPFLWDDAFLQSCESSGALKTHGHLIHSINLATLSTFLEHAPPTLPQLMSVEIKDLKGDDESIAEFFRRCTGGLRKFVVHNYVWDTDTGFGLRAVAALLGHHASTLEIVRMNSVPHSNLDSEDIQQLLCTAPNLKELYLLGATRYADRRDGRLNARDVVRSEWVCTKLEVFGCEIDGIPRPDITREICFAPPEEFLLPGTSEESIALQRQVYTQLGRLTRLRQLTLGARCSSRQSDFGSTKEEDRLYGCLAMTLVSGLDLLRNLNKLERVGLQDMEVYFGQKEWEWAMANWPGCHTILYDTFVPRRYVGFESLV